MGKEGGGLARFFHLFWYQFGRGWEPGLLSWGAISQSPSSSSAWLAQFQGSRRWCEIWQDPWNYSGWLLSTEPTNITMELFKMSKEMQVSLKEKLTSYREPGSLHFTVFYTKENSLIFHSQQLCWFLNINFSCSFQNIPLVIFWVCLCRGQSLFEAAIKHLVNINYLNHTI